MVPQIPAEIPQFVLDRIGTVSFPEIIRSAHHFGRIIFQEKPDSTVQVYGWIWRLDQWHNTDPVSTSGFAYARFIHDLATAVTQTPLRGPDQWYKDRETADPADELSRIYIETLTALHEANVLVISEQQRLCVAHAQQVLKDAISLRTAAAAPKVVTDAQ